MGSEPETEPEEKTAAGGERELPWQLKMFSKTLKKQQKLRLLLDQAGALDGLRCALITNGDNNGALNYHFRARGGAWTWIELEADHIDEMAALLGEPVLRGTPARLPADDAVFDLVISIDVHEHLDDCVAFNRELHRIVRPGGRVVVTTPNAGAWRPVTVVKHLVGMTKEKYGHKVIGYSVAQHRAMLGAAGLRPIADGSYSKLFTESLELLINFAYVMVLARKSKTEVAAGTIAPSSDDQLRAVAKQYRAYAAAYPLLLAISKLDLLLRPLTGYAVSVVAERPA